MSNGTIFLPCCCCLIGEDCDAVGPDCPTALQLFTAIRDATGSWATVQPGGRLLSTKMITRLTQPINMLTGDILLDEDDLDLLCNGLTLARENPNDPRIKTRRSLFEWIKTNGDSLDTIYVNSIDRYYKLDK
jgi:hypothetical protein